MIRVGFGFDSHRFTEGRPLWIGGVSIAYSQGLMGHSDADVLLHALCDAILGAAGLGDIGRHFPDNDARYRGISSLILFDQVREKMTQAGYILAQVDATVVLEEPRLHPYIRRMEETIAATAKISPERINVKAKTNEGMGFIGRGEGVAAFAVVVLERGDAGSSGR